MMPEMDGIETLHEIRKLSNCPNHDTPVIALTANALSGAREGYLKEGFADFLTKPIDGDLLEQTTMKYLPETLIRNAMEAGEETEKDNVEMDDKKYLQYGISIENGLLYAKKDREMYLDLVRMFVKDRTKQDTIYQFLVGENMKDYAILVHGLKGNARMLGADQLADMAFEHEKQSKAENLEYVKMHWEELLSIWEKTLDGFEELIRTYGKEQEDKYAAVNSDGKDVLILSECDLAKVVDFLEDFETDQAIELLKEWIGRPLEPSMHDCIKNVLIALEDEFDEEKAIELLKEKGGMKDVI